MQYKFNVKILKELFTVRTFYTNRHSLIEKDIIEFKSSPIFAFLKEWVDNLSSVIHFEGCFNMKIRDMTVSSTLWNRSLRCRELVKPSTTRRHLSSDPSIREHLLLASSCYLLRCSIEGLQISLSKSAISRTCRRHLVSHGDSASAWRGSSILTCGARMRVHGLVKQEVTVASLTMTHSRLLL